MAIIYNDNFSVHANKPVDNRYLNISTPWASVSEVNANIPEPYRYVGLTVNIDKVEYWYYTGTTDGDLVQRSMGSLNNAINGLRVLSATTVSLGGTLTGNTIFNGDASMYTLRYGGDYSSAYSNRSLVDKEYVDSIASGLRPKQAVKVATTTEITLSGLTIVDGYQLQTGDRVLVKNQSSGATNGIYSASTGTWGRTSDFDGSPSSEVVSGSYMFVNTGNTNIDSAWILSTPDPITIGVTPLTFVLFTHSESIVAGVGITISATTGGKQINFDGASVAGSCLSWDGTQLNVDSASQCILNNAITGGTNGLSVVNHSVKLGGLLSSGETMICMPYSEPSSLVVGYGTPSTWTGGRLKICRDSAHASGNTVCIGARTNANNSMVIAMYATSGMTFATSIGGVSHGMKLDGAALAYDACYHADYTKRSLVDKEYVTGITSTLVATANNGLNRVGDNIRLGGALTGDTYIDGNYTLNLCGDARFNSDNGYQISGVTVFRTPPSTITSIYIGQNAGSNEIGCNNIGIGENSLSQNSIVEYSIAVGNNALSGATGGTANVAIGNNAFAGDIAPYYGVAIGNCALRTGYGSYSVAIGNCALHGGGSVNVAIGESALYCGGGGFNVALGDNAMYHGGGCGNIAIGHYSSYCSGCVNGSNVSIGYSALYNNTIGNSNIGIGAQSFSCLVCGNFNVGIGNATGYYNTTGSSNVFIGNCAGLNEQGSNKLYIANTNACTLIYGDFAQNYVILPTLKLSTTPSAGTTSDGILVWNSSDKCVKQVSCASAFGSVITGATNGLTKTGKNVVLGGTLTGATSINLNEFDFRLKSDGSTSYGIADFNLSQTYANSKFAICSRDATSATIWGITGNSTNITAVHCSNSSNGSCLSINNGDINLTNKTSSCSRVVCLGANALVYGACYHGDYTNRSLVDKEYVDVSICNESNVIKVCNVGAPYTTTRYDDFIGVSGTSCIYLYNTPVCGQRVIVTDICGNALLDPITVDGNGKKINNGTCSTINTDYGSITYLYNGFCWSAVGFIN
jgi:hypothetical protein